ncbi:glycosyltransferase [Negadavirga shengliensis]|uniref:Glycosyltransferase n=1 Tax=Negadavirga shengliensis TaxID=1389218 RepID=A0ABV9T478_9BACT
MSDPPLVSVICTCFNQGKYVSDALNSILLQQYPNLELFVIDNGSQDDSSKSIEKWVQKHKEELEIGTFYYRDSQNYCWAFNQALFKSRGKYVVDLAADDFLHPGHIRTAVDTLQGSNAAAYFSNALLMDEKGRTQAFYSLDKRGNLRQKVPQGDIYALLVRKYILCTATLVFDAGCLKEEGGYDERLSYEDFDIIVRLSRKHDFVFHEHIGITKRILKKSYSAQQYLARNSVMLPSTYRICRKIQAMNKTPEEKEALKHRVMHETKHALASANFETAEKFLGLAADLEISGFTYRLYRMWKRTGMDLSALYRKWQHVRKGLNR